MKTAQQKLVDLEARHAKETAKIKKEAEILKALPGTLADECCMVFIHSLYGSIGSVKFSAATKEEAADIFRQFELVKANKVKDGCFVSFVPESFQKGEIKDSCLIRASIDNYSQKVKAFAMLNGEIIDVEIELPRNYFGHYVREDRHRRKYWYYKFTARPDTLKNYKGSMVYAAASQYGDMSAKNHIYYWDSI